MIKMQRYFGFILLFNFFGLSAMNFYRCEPSDNEVLQFKIAFEAEIEKRINNVVEQVRDKIDEVHLGIPKDIYFRGIEGAVASYLKSSFLTEVEVKNELNTILSYIEEEQVRNRFYTGKSFIYYPTKCLNYTIEIDKEYSVAIYKSSNICKKYENKDYLFERLASRHWYVHFLKQEDIRLKKALYLSKSISDKVEQLEAKKYV